MPKPHLSGQASLQLVNPERRRSPVATPNWTLRKLIDQDRTFIFMHRRDPEIALRRLARLPANLLDAPLRKGLHDPLLAFQRHAIELGQSPHTVNHACALVRVALRYAYERGLIKDYPHGLPLALHVPPSRWRPLTLQESSTLRQALATRNETFRRARDSANARRIAHGLPPLPDLRDVPFVDELEPIILLVWESGLQDSEWPVLEWRDIDLEEATLRVVLGRRRLICLTTTAKALLERWRLQSNQSDLVFPPAGLEPVPPDRHSEIRRKMAMRHAITIRRSFARLVARAGLHDLRLADLRKDFAAQLCHAGVPLDAVTFLLGRYVPHLPRLCSSQTLMQHGIRALEAHRLQAEGLGMVPLVPEPGTSQRP